MNMKVGAEEMDDRFCKIEIIQQMKLYYKQSVFQTSADPQR